MKACTSSGGTRVSSLSLPLPLHLTLALMLNILTLLTLKMLLLQWKTHKHTCPDQLPLPTWMATAHSNSTKRANLVHQAQPADHVKLDTRPAAANKWTKGIAPSTAPSTQYPTRPGNTASPFKPSTLANAYPSTAGIYDSPWQFTCPNPPCTGQGPQAPAPGHRPGQGLHWNWHTKWQDCPMMAAFFTNKNGPGSIDTMVSKHSSSAPASRKRSASAAPPPPAQHQ